MAVVAYLYQIVYFHIVLDYGAAEGCSFYSCVAADKHIIANDYISEVWEMYRIAFFIPLKTETFLSQNGSRFYLAVLAKYYAVVEYHIGVQYAVVSYNTFC